DVVIGKLVQHGQLDGELMQLRKRSGEPFWAELSARIVELDGQRCSLVGIFDVTAQKDLEAQLRELATCDSLTGAATRRHFVELAQRERERSLRSGSPLSLCMFDADHFKNVNDQYGHVAGDHVLAAIAQAARSKLRKSDVLGRLGGEEFGILLPDTALPGALTLAERVRVAVADVELQTSDMPPDSSVHHLVPGGGPADEAAPGAPNPTITATISIGVAELRKGEPFEALLKRADRALYAAKDLGRNRVQA
ncbi:MAG TPA: GGDEF domain-containing protein, partial [Polyangiaceae bacterium]|nr:GGDEF domain-containing protein [Polyangiaceae bacterium]